jgi:hypothetical protein
MKVGVGLTALVVSAALAGCSVVVDQFKDRVYSANYQTNDAMNEETLLNIVRASQSEPLTFVGIGKVTGGRTEALKLGLPSITFGPQQTVAQGQYSFTSNGLDNSASAGFESNPLTTTQFQRGMLTPINMRQLALLVAVHGREHAFLATIEALDLRIGDEFYSFRNDPAGDFRIDRETNEISSVKCSLEDYDPYSRLSRKPDDPEIVAKTDSDYMNAVLLMVLYPRDEEKYDPRECNYTKFRALLRAMLFAGLSADSPESPRSDEGEDDSERHGEDGTGADDKGGDKQKKGGDREDDKGGGKAREAKGMLCLDRGLVQPGFEVREPVKESWFGLPICGNSDKRSTSRCEIASTSGALGRPTREDNKPEQQEASVERRCVNARMRSPLAVYSYLGRILNLEQGDRPRFETFDAKGRFARPKGPDVLVEIERDRRTKECRVAIDHAGHSYCVPQSPSTLNILALLQNLKNLNTQASDLNSAISVRVSQ